MIGAVKSIPEAVDYIHTYSCSSKIIYSDSNSNSEFKIQLLNTILNDDSYDSHNAARTIQNIFGEDDMLTNCVIKKNMDKGYKAILDAIQCLKTITPEALYAYNRMVAIYREYNRFD